VTGAVRRPWRAVKGVSAATMKSSAMKSADMAAASMEAAGMHAATATMKASTVETSTTMETASAAAVEATTTSMTTAAAATMATTTTGGVGQICGHPHHRRGKDRQQCPTNLASSRHFFLPEDGSARDDSTRKL
jgi:hypothetical protein